MAAEGATAKTESDANEVKTNGQGHGQNRTLQGGSPLGSSHKNPTNNSGDSAAKESRSYRKVHFARVRTMGGTGTRCEKDDHH
jgi:hypothetical protein